MFSNLCISARITTPVVLRMPDENVKYIELQSIVRAVISLIEHQPRVSQKPAMAQKNCFRIRTAPERLESRSNFSKNNNQEEL